MLNCLLRETIKNRVLYFTFRDNQKPSVVKCHVTFIIQIFIIEQILTVSCSDYGTNLAENVAICLII